MTDINPDGAAQGLRRRRVLAAAAGVAVAVPGMLRAQDAAARNRELYMYKGADRDARLLEGARKEGTVSIYTSLNTKDSGPIIAVIAACASAVVCFAVLLAVYYHRKTRKPTRAKTDVSSNEGKGS